MKNVRPLFAILILITLVSCQPDADDILPEQPPAASGKIKLMEMTTKYYYVNEVVGNTILFIKDSAERTITLLMDSAKNSYERYFFDEEGRLFKKVFNNIDTAAAPDRDSIVISRTGDGHFTFTHTNGSVDYKVSASPDGGRIIVVRSDSYDERYRLNRDGYLLTLEHVQPRINPGDGSTYGKDSTICWYRYDANNKLTQRLDTFFSTMGDISVVKYDITKDNATNSFLIDFEKILTGSDLNWICHINGINGITWAWFDYIFPNPHFLRNGSITQSTWTSAYASDGTNFLPVGVPNVRTSQIGYDVKGRILTYGLRANNTLEQEVTFKYFD